MAKFNLPFVKDLGLQRKVMDALPYAVVGDTWEGSLSNNIGVDDHITALNYIVPAGQQLKILFLRVYTTATNGARFSIIQTNPTGPNQTGTVEAYPVVGSVPPFPPATTATRDYPMLEAAGAEVLHGSLRDPIHVLEGSIDFRLLGPQLGPTEPYYGIVWWGVIKIPE